MRASLKVLFGVLVLLLAISAVVASVSFTPPGGKKMYVGSLPLKATSAAGKATASVTVVCQSDLSKGMVTVQANALDPSGAYTVSVVKAATRKTLGKLKVTDKGFGNLMADVANCKELVTQRLEVQKGTVIVFSGELSKLMQK